MEIEVAAFEWPDESEWLAAGYGQAKQGYKHWLPKGAEHVQRWVDFREENPQLRVVAVEAEVSHGTGTGEIKAFLDRVLYDEDKEEHILLDIKSGSKRPESKQQLGIYSVLWNISHEDEFFIREGYYFMTKDGGLHPKDGDLSHWTLDTLKKLGQEWNRAKEARIYLPVMSNGCETCSVKAACYVKSGDTPTTREYDSLNPRYQGEQ